MIQFLFFDFGGCLDSAGVHTRTMFRCAFEKASLLSVGDTEQLAKFQEAYTKADEIMIRMKLALGQRLRPFNRLNAKLIAEYMKLHGVSQQIQAAADEVSALQSDHLRKSAGVLENIYIPKGIISNFTGNLEVILEEFELRRYFSSVTESFYVGASKPEEKIFRYALAQQKYEPALCAFIGDNPKNDIEPAKKLGIKTILIHEPGKKIDCGADAYLSDLAELPSLVQRI